MESLRLVDDGAEIVIDLRHAPLYLSVWRGRLTTAIVTELFDFCADVARASLAERGRVAYVNEVGAVERPDAEVRRVVGDLSVALARDGLSIASVGSWQIIGNPLIRGALKALGWVTNNVVDGRVASSWADGITLAVAALTAAGQAPPFIDAHGYRFPVALEPLRAGCAMREVGDLDMP